MPLTIDDLDSPVTADSQTSFVGGQFSNAVPLQIGEDQCSLIEDCEVSLTGAASSRRGTVYLGNPLNGSVIKALGYFKTAIYDYPVAISGGQPQKLSAGNWINLGTKTLLTPNDQAAIIEHNGFLYFATGSGNISRWDGSAWSDLTTDSPPTSVNFLISHTNRLVAANATIGGTASIDGVFFSGIEDDTIWSTMAGGFQIQPGVVDGSEITGLLSWSNFNIACFKRNSVWLIGADPALDVSDFEVTLVHGRIGCVAPYSIAQVGADILFLSQDGVRSLQQTIASNNQYQLGTPLSFPIQDVLNRVSPAQASKACATFWKGLYILALPIDGSATNNYIVVYNTLTGKWSGGWTNLPVSCFSVRNDIGIDKLVMGLNDSPRVIEFLDYVSESDATDATYTDYDGTFVNPHIITRGMVFGDLDSQKKGLNAKIKLFRSKGQLDITANMDEGGYSITKTIDVGDPFGFPIPFDLPFMLPRPGVQPANMNLFAYPHFHQLQFELRGQGAGRKEIRQITANAFPEATDLRDKFAAR